METYTTEQSARSFFSWEAFCEKVKFDWRYTFLLDEQGSDGLYAPLKTLKEICMVIENSDWLITELTPEETLYRGRCFASLSNADCGNVKALGTPPKENAIKPSRFSPVGLPVFYGSFEQETVMQEICGNEKYLVMAEFHTVKTIKVLDLTRLERLETGIGLPEDSPLLFLHALSNAVSAPVCDDNALDYIPTQVFAEYIRRTHLCGVQGIKYWSALTEEGKNVALFYSNEDCGAGAIEKQDGLALGHCRVYARTPSYKRLAVMSL